MNKSAITELLRVRDNVCEVVRDYEKKFKGLILQRAKNKSIYIPGDLFRLDDREYITRIFLDVDNDIKVEVWNGSNSRPMPWSFLSEEQRRKFLFGIDDTILSEQERFRIEQKEFAASLEYQVADSRYRHAIVETIKQLHKDNRHLLGDKFELYISTLDYKKHMELYYDKGGKTFRCIDGTECTDKSVDKEKYGIHDYPRFITDYNVEILKVVKEQLRCEIYRLKTAEKNKQAK